MRLILRYIFFTFGSSVLQHFGGGGGVLGCGMWPRAARECLYVFFLIHTEISNSSSTYLLCSLSSLPRIQVMTERSEISISTFNKKPCVRKIARQAGGIVFCVSGAHLEQKKPIYLSALVSLFWRHHTLPSSQKYAPITSVEEEGIV